MEAKIEIVLPKGRECQRITCNHQKQGERLGTASPLEPSEGANLTDTLISDF